MARWRREGRPSVAGPFGCRCLTRPPRLRFHTPLIKPDRRVSRIRLSDEDSRVRPREAARPLLEPEQSQLLVQERVGEACRPLVRHLVFAAQPLTQPTDRVVIHDLVGGAHRAQAEVFEACSAFTHVPAGVLARSPEVIVSEGFDRFVTSTTAPAATDWSDQFVGWESHPL